ncbi:MAG: EAL domain-containing protein [Negativicutes bacterium]|nr:EAL domain-containing protein [Negativicutes bacterium]
MAGFRNTCSNIFARLINRDARWFVVFLCFVVIVWSWFATYKWEQEEYEKEIQSIHREHSNLARAFEEHVRRTLAGVDEVMLLVKEAYERTGRVDDTIQSYLSWARTNPVLTQQMNIIDKNGYYVASVIPVAPGTSVADRPYYQIHIPNQNPEFLFIDKPFIGRVTGKMTIQLSRRLNRPDGSFGGVVSVALDPQYFLNFYQQMEMGNSQSVILIGLDGFVRARYYRGETTIGQDIRQSPLWRHVAEQPQGTYESPGLLTNLNRISSYRVMPDYPLVVSIGIAKTEALASFEARKRREYASTGVFTLLVLVFGRLSVGQITRQQQARRETELQKARLAAVFDNIPHVTWFKDVAGRYVAVNQPFIEKSGLPGEAIVGKTDFELWPHDVAAAYHQEDQETIKTGRQMKLVGRAAYLQEEVWEETYKAPVFGPGGELWGTTGISLDITERRQYEEEIHRMAYFDGLTNLPNRTYIKQQLDRELGKARTGKASGAVLFIDMDDLKSVNDTFGHSYGDEVIVTAGAQLAAEVGKAAVVARIGGDEFIVLIPGEGDRDKISRIADRMIKALSRDYSLGDSTTHLSASIGIAIYPQDGDQTEDILKNADTALYAAKGSGKNVWRFYDTRMQEFAYENMTLKRSLRGAGERGELALHFQPQVAVADRRIIGFEALLRWNSPQHGSVPPGRFIPLAEESDTIQTIGKWVLAEACRFAGMLAGMGKGGLTVWVNVSARQLAAGDFAAIVGAAVRDAGIEPRQLGIEITETVLLSSLSEGIHKLQELKNLGVGLSLDDFGTGYSSLTYLRNLPVETLKIDKSFIDNIVSEQVQEPFVSAIVDMAHILGLKVVAEGVETKEQLDKLRRCRCDGIQGYLFSRPLPEAEAIKLLTDEL